MVPSVFITHQLNILIPNKPIQYLVKRMNNHYLTNFSEIWVPDYSDNPSLCGILGHGSLFNNVKYIGLLSRLESYQIQTDNSYDIVAVLSGPEPQRSVFEKILMRQLKLLPQKSLIIKGKPNEDIIVQKDGVVIESFADMDKLVRLLKGASMIISRSGYSSLMDYAKLGVGPLLLVPTPGQTEQEYLAKNLYDSGVAIYQKQKALDVKMAWSEKENYKGLDIKFNEDILKKTVSDFLKRL